MLTVNVLPRNEAKWKNARYLGFTEWRGYVSNRLERLRTLPCTECALTADELFSSNLLQASPAKHHLKTQLFIQQTLEPWLCLLLCLVLRAWAPNTQPRWLWLPVHLSPSRSPCLWAQSLFLSFGAAVRRGHKSLSIALQYHTKVPCPQRGDSFAEMTSQGCY